MKRGPAPAERVPFAPLERLIDLRCRARGSSWCETISRWRRAGIPVEQACRLAADLGLQASLIWETL